MTHAVVRELKTVIGSRRRSSTSSNETDVGLKIVLNKSSDDSSASSPFQDSSFLSSTTSSDEIVLPMSYLDSKVETEVPSSSYDYLHAGILEAIRPRAKIPVTSYGDSDDD
uniref:Protein CUSTOS n=1 Tax=Syphacia muris TaxID=451379 RepID=A0A0N5A8R9_9BILA